MKKISLIFFGTCLSFCSFGQATENDKLIELGTAYKDFMFRNEPPKDFVRTLQTTTQGNLTVTTNFIVQTITTDNDILDLQYLALPDEESLRLIYIVRAINHNVRKEDQIDNFKLIDSLKKSAIPKNELVDGYYSMLFASVANKDQPFDLSKINFKPNEYKLANNTEKGIFFLQCMDFCGMAIWGYMNVPKPPNTSEAYHNIKKFPLFNGLKYYQFTDLYFADFEMFIIEGKEKESYKSYYIDKYYDLLLSHLICLNKENAKEKDINDLLLGSILKDKNLYKYTKNKETLESSFKEQR